MVTLWIWASTAAREWVTYGMLTALGSKNGTQDKNI
jgi:hypothetical protein